MRMLRWPSPKTLRRFPTRVRPSSDRFVLNYSSSAPLVHSYLIVAVIKPAVNKAHRVLRPVGLSFVVPELLWLFYGLGGLHVDSAPSLTSHLARVAPCLTSLVATGAPR